MLEFCLMIPIWLPLLIGTFLYGNALIRQQEMMQMVRDLGSMYSRGINFSSGGAVANGASLNLVTHGDVVTGGQGTAIFSTVIYVGNNLCPGGACANYGYYVFTQQYKQPAGSSAVSYFGAAGGTLDTDGISIKDYLTNSAARSKFNLIPAPTQAVPNQDGYQAGQPIYIVEMFYSGGGVGGFSGGGGTYAYAVF